MAGLSLSSALTLSLAPRGAAGGGPSRYIKPGSGNDSAAGTIAAPWDSWANVTSSLEANTTIYLDAAGNDITAPLVAPSVSGLRIEGINGKPKINAFISIKGVAGNWTEVADDGTTPAPGSKKWARANVSDGTGQYLIAFNGAWRTWRRNLISELDRLYDWYIDASKVVIYSTTNPGTFFTSLEITSEAAFGIDAAACPGITIKNVDVKGFRGGIDLPATRSTVQNAYVHLNAGPGVSAHRAGIHSGAGNVIQDCGWEYLDSTTDVDSFGLWCKGETGTEVIDLTWFDTKIRNCRDDCVKLLNLGFGSLIRLWSTYPGATRIIQRGTHDENVCDNQSEVLWLQGAYIASNNDPDRTALITASCTGTVMTVTAQSGAPLKVGMGVTADGLTGYRKISSLGTGTGGTGTYNLDTSTTFSSGSMTATELDPNSTTHIFGRATIYENCCVNGRHTTTDGYAIFCRKGGGGAIGWGSMFFGRGTSGPFRAQDGGNYTFSTSVFKSVGSRLAYSMENGRHNLSRVTFMSGSTSAVGTSGVTRSGVITTSTVMYRAAASNGDGTTSVYGTCTSATNYVNPDSFLELSGVTNYTGLNGIWYVDSVVQTGNSGLFTFKVPDAVAATLPANPTTFTLTGSLSLKGHPVIDRLSGCWLLGGSNVLSIGAMSHLTRANGADLTKNAYHDNVGGDACIRMTGDANNSADTTTRIFTKDLVTSNNGSTDVFYYTGGHAGGPTSNASDADAVGVSVKTVSALSITSGTATATVTGHGWTVGTYKQVLLEGVSLADVYGFHFVYVEDADTVTFLAEWYLGNQSVTGAMTMTDTTPDAGSPALVNSLAAAYSGLPLPSTTTRPYAVTPALQDVCGTALGTTGFVGAVTA